MSLPYLKSIHLQFNLIQLHTSTMGPKRRLPAKQTSLTEAALSQVPATQVLDSVATNLAIPTPTLVVEAENQDEHTRAPTTRKFEGDDYIELVIARHPKTSWYWQHGMEMECQRVNAKGRHDRFWVCKSCKRFHKHSIGHSQHIENHLKNVHQIKKTR